MFEGDDPKTEINQQIMFERSPIAKMFSANFPPPVKKKKGKRKDEN